MPREEALEKAKTKQTNKQKNKFVIIINKLDIFILFCLVVVVVIAVAISWAAPTAYGGSQARGLTGAVATGLRQSHSNAGSELRLRPTPQLMAMPEPSPTERGQRSNLQPHGSQSDSLTTEP